MSGRVSVDRRLVTDVFADDATLQHGGEALAVRGDLSGAILRSLSANVAVLDRRGVIMAAPLARARLG